MESKTTKYSIDYILEQIEKIREQTEHINGTLKTLSEMGDGENGEMGSPGNIQGQAKAQALAEIVRCRETTNQQMLRLYEKMYDDLQVRDPKIKHIISANRAFRDACQSLIETFGKDSPEVEELKNDYLTDVKNALERLLFS